MVARNVALAEATGARVHMAHVTTAGGRGVAAQGQGTGYTSDGRGHSSPPDNYGGVGDSEVGPPRPLRHQCEGQSTASKPVRTRTRSWPPWPRASSTAWQRTTRPTAPRTRTARSMRRRSASAVWSLLLARSWGLVHEGRLDLPTMVERMTAGPARVLGRSGPMPGNAKAGQPRGRRDIRSGR